MCVVHVLSFSRKKEGAETCYTVGGPQKHGATWKKTDMKGPRLYDSTDAKDPEKLNPWRQSGWMVARGWGAGKMGVDCIMGLGFLLRTVKMFWS